jgi:hypothetical protein
MLLLSSCPRDISPVSMLCGFWLRCNSVSRNKTGKCITHNKNSFSPPFAARKNSLTLLQQKNQCQRDRQDQHQAVPSSPFPSPPPPPPPPTSAIPIISLLLFPSSSNPPPSNSIRRPHLTTLPNPSPARIPKTLIRSNLTPPNRGLINRRRRITSIISRRRRRIHPALHPDHIRVLCLLAVVRVLVVHWVAVRVIGVVVARVVWVVGIVVVGVVALYHPAVVG